MGAGTPTRPYARTRKSLHRNRFGAAHADRDRHVRTMGKCELAWDHFDRSAQTAAGLAKPFPSAACRSWRRAARQAVPAAAQFSAEELCRNAVTRAREDLVALPLILLFGGLLNPFPAGL